MESAGRHGSTHTAPFRPPYAVGRLVAALVGPRTRTQVLQYASTHTYIASKDTPSANMSPNATPVQS